MITRLLSRAARFSRCCSALGFLNTLNLYRPTKASAIALALTDGGEFFVRPGTSDTGVFLSVFRDGQYPSFNRTSVTSFLDAGANIGCASRWWLRNHPAAHVVAVEPDQGNFEILRRNMEAYASQSVLIRGVVWHSRTTVKFTNSTGNASSYRVNDGGAATVDAYTIDELAGHTPTGGFDVVKLDIEGAEREVFAARDSLRWLDTARAVVVELHDWYSPGAAREMARAFADRDFALNLSGENLVWIRRSAFAEMRAEN